MADDHQTKTGAAPATNYQFGLRTLLVLPVIVVVYFASAHVAGPCLAGTLTLPIALIVARFHPATRKLATGLLVVYFLMLLLVVVLLPTGGHPEAARRSQCSNNLKQIGIALHNYHDRYGSFPPAYITDDQGQPMHSWRVLLLPFLEQQKLYDRYRFDEPWNGSNNIMLVDEMPQVFQCPSNQADGKKCLNYLAVIGPRTAWPGDRSVRFADVVDGTSNTWLVVEVADSGIAWSEPRDLHVLQMSREINPTGGQGISSKHPGGAIVLYVDGSVSFIGNATNRYPRSAFDSDDVHAALTINGGEPAKQP